MLSVHHLQTKKSTKSIHFINRITLARDSFLVNSQKKIWLEIKCFENLVHISAVVDTKYKYDHKKRQIISKIL